MGRTVGIDLGTTTTEIAYIKNGKPETIKIGYSSVMPSVVGFTKDMELVVGQLAKNQLVSASDRTVAEIKRKMGTSETVLLAGKKFTPVEISAFILKELKEKSEEFLQEPITNAVITVPANFNDAQRQATKEAGEKAGLQVDRIINEPTAAALAFGIDNMDTEGKVLVYDLGGGTFDVTVLDMIDGALDVMASRGRNQLGGKDLDMVIEKEILDRFQKEYEMDLSQNLRTRARIREEAESAKIMLSATNTANINMPFIAFKDGEPINFEMDITRSHYEKLISDYILQTRDTVQEALDAAGITAQDVDVVLAVGGSSRTPLVQQTLKDLFGDKIRGGVNPDEAVALGAAVQAGLITDELASASNIAIFDVCNHTLGTAVLNESKTGLLYDRLIDRDTHLPYAHKNSYSTVNDDQTTVSVKVYQGESYDISENVLIGTVDVTGIPPRPAGEESITIEYVYNINGILEVNVEVLSTGVVTHQEFNMYNYDAPESAEERSVEEPENYSMADSIKTTVMLYQARRDTLSEENRHEADRLMQQLKAAVAGGNQNEIEKIDDQLTSLLFGI